MVKVPRRAVFNKTTSTDLFPLNERDAAFRIAQETLTALQKFQISAHEAKMLISEILTHYRADHSILVNGGRAERGEKAMGRALCEAYVREANTLLEEIKTGKRNHGNMNVDMAVIDHKLGNAMTTIGTLELKDQRTTRIKIEELSKAARRLRCGSMSAKHGKTTPGSDGGAAR